MISHIITDYITTLPTFQTSQTLTHKRTLGLDSTESSCSSQASSVLNSVDQLDFFISRSKGVKTLRQTPSEGTPSMRVRRTHSNACGHVLPRAGTSVWCLRQADAESNSRGPTWPWCTWCRAISGKHGVGWGENDIHLFWFGEMGLDWPKMVDVEK